MTNRTHHRSLRGRVTFLAALGVTSLAFVAATPASAINRSYEPIDAEAPVIKRTANTDDTGSKKGCSVNLQKPDGSPGQTVVYEHGYSFSVINGVTGKTHTYTCNNGTWDETVSSTSPVGDGYFYEVDDAYVNGSATLVFENPHVEHSYSIDGAYHAAP